MTSDDQTPDDQAADELSPGTLPDDQTPAAGAVPGDPTEPAAPVAPATVAAPARPVRRSLVVSWVVGLLVVALVAGLLGGLAALLAGVTTSGDWGGLVAVLAGFMVAAGAAGTGWLVLVLLTVQRRVPAGRRVRVTGISVGAVAVTLAVGYALSQVSGIGSGASALVVGALAVVAALLPPELVSREERRMGAVARPAQPVAAGPTGGVAGTPVDGSVGAPAERPTDDPAD